jgi:large subunit ribosomal protein L10
MVEQLRSLLEGCTIAISADYSGMSVGAMTELRRSLRDKGVEFHVVKNRLVYLAADAAGKPAVKEIVQGPTGLALGFGDPVEPARALSEFLSSTRHPLAIKGGVLGDRVLTAQEVDSLALLPSKDQLIAQLLGLLQGPITGLARVLNAPLSALVTVLQRHMEASEDEEQPGSEDAPDAAASPGGQGESPPDIDPA